MIANVGVPQSLVEAFEKSHAPILTLADNQLREDLRPVPMVEYQERPLAFAVEILGIPEHTIRWSLSTEYAGHEWDGTRDPLLQILDTLVEGLDCCVESGTGTGKSFLGAIIVLWFLACFEDARVFTFAPKEEQLRLYIWAELTTMWPRFQAKFPHAKLTDLRIRMVPGSDKWAAHGYSVMVKADQQSAVAAQGMHAPHMLLIYEETPGIPLPVIEAGYNTATGGHNLRLALGNPDHQLDALHLFGFDEKGQPRFGVRHVRISALDHPNVVCRRELIPGAVTVKSVERRRSDHGERSRSYESRVRGISPKEAADALIKLEWVQAAQRAWEQEMARPESQRIYRLGKRAIGVDVANSNDGDEAAIAEGQGPCLLKIEAFPCPNANQLGFRVAQMVKDSRKGVVHPRDAIEDLNVGIDVIGVGAGAYNEMTARDVWPRALHSGPMGDQWMPPESGFIGGEYEFRTLRAAMWWLAREDLRQGHLMLPPDLELARDLITPTWKPQGKAVVVESKEEIKARTPGGKSPNKGDAFVYWNWVRDRTVLATAIPKRNPTIAERLQKELEDLDKQERMQSGDPIGRNRFGGVLRQG